MTILIFECFTFVGEFDAAAVQVTDCPHPQTFELLVLDEAVARKEQDWGRTGGGLGRSTGCSTGEGELGDSYMGD